jgi:two-component system sensor histidine kinase PilS (NtrC family)
MIEDMRLLLLADSRFVDIEIINRVSSHVMILADIHQISQVIMNLLHNSADAMPEGGTIIIDSRFLMSGANGFRKSPVTLISVTDSGRGIDSEAARHVFEPFWTTKADGTGLGLAIIYRIIEAHGGSINVDAPTSGGCRFTIILPV